MIYPKNFEQKIGFDEIRRLLRERCLSSLGKEMVDQLSFSTKAESINEWLTQVREFRRIGEEAAEFPLQYFFDLRASVSRLRLEGTHMDESELFDLRRSQDTVCRIVAFLNRSDGTDSQDEPVFPYPALQRLTGGILTVPGLIRRIDQILDPYGKMRDNASADLQQIRRDLARTEGSISRILNSILRSAQSEGLVEKDVTPTMRDGRLVIPVAPAMKRKVKGIVHDESASGKTVFIEPTEVVEANNRIRELEMDERREIIRILTDFAKEIRPHVPALMESYRFLAKIDLIRAKAELAQLFDAYEPVVEKRPHIDWIRAIHPLLQLSLTKQGKKVVPLDIMLTREKHILIISGPNAGGKSVCLKTAGLLQYMLQCGLSIPVSERSHTGIFEHIMIDIGDEQSIENDLSTYSSHLLNMKNMMRQANERTLLLIDEFGTGTEPLIGGAIAESVLRQFCKKKAWGIITTHYQNLKHFAEDHEGVVNGAMLYDRHEMRALFQLQIGQPGSSFAIEIARKTGIPEEVIQDASEIVGSDYIQSDKYLQDIVRDKRYWEGKRQTIHQREKEMEKTIAHYEQTIRELEQSRKEVLQRAKAQAEELLAESNRRIENTIREIKESQAEKEETRRIREELNTFKQEVSEIDTRATDEMIERKMQQIQRRQKKKQEARNKGQGARGKEQGTGGKGQENSEEQKAVGKAAEISVGDTVRIKGLSTVGTVESTDGKMATVIFGDMRTKMRAERLEHAEKPKQEEEHTYVQVSRETRETIDNRRQHFRQEIDVRGMRGDEALNAVMYFIDDAILVGMSRVRILHGTGNGILRQLIRQYLGTVPNVKHFQDEHVQFGGAGITVVDL